MELRDLKIFLTVVKTGNISQAAKQLGYVQSNVTSRIQQLEKEFDTALFYRHGRGVSLTLKGEILLKYAEKVIHLCSEAKNELLNNDVPRGPLRIGSMESTFASRLPNVLVSFQSEYPEVDLSIRTGPTEELVQDVLEYKLDGAFIAGSVEHPELIREKIITEQMVLISNNRLTPLLTAQDIRDRTFLVFKTGYSYRLILEKLLLSKAIVPTKIMELGTLDGIIGCVVAGVGISFVPKSAVENCRYESSLFVHEVPSEFAKVATFFIRRNDVLNTKALQEFLTITKTLLNETSQPLRYTKASS